MSAALDISPFLEAKSDQITADDLLGGPRSFRITRVETPGGDQPVWVHLEGSEGKPFKPCKGMRRLLAHFWGPKASQWVGRTVTLFRDPDVRFGADQTGGVRVAAVSHIDAPATVPVRVSRGKLKPYTVQPVKGEQQANASDDLGAWAHKFIASIARVPDAAKLDAGVAKVQDKIDALAEQIPDAHAAVTQAIEDKRASFGADDEADPFTEAEPAAWQPFVEGITGRIAAATTEAELDEIKADIAKADHVPEAEGDKLIVLEARKRREIGKA